MSLVMHKYISLVLITTILGRLENSRSNFVPCSGGLDEDDAGGGGDKLMADCDFILQCFVTVGVSCGELIGAVTAPISC